MILVSDFTYLMLVLSSLHLSSASIYAFLRIAGRGHVKRHLVLGCIGLIIPLSYNPFIFDPLGTMLTNTALCVVFGYLSLDAIIDGKRYSKAKNKIGANNG